MANCLILNFIKLMDKYYKYKNQSMYACMYACIYIYCKYVCKQAAFYLVTNKKAKAAIWKHIDKLDDGVIQRDQYACHYECLTVCPPEENINNPRRTHTRKKILKVLIIILKSLYTYLVPSM